MVTRVSASELLLFILFYISASRRQRIYPPKKELQESKIDCVAVFVSMLLVTAVQAASAPSEVKPGAVLTRSASAGPRQAQMGRF